MIVILKATDHYNLWKYTYQWMLLNLHYHLVTSHHKKNNKMSSCSFSCDQYKTHLFILLFYDHLIMFFFKAIYKYPYIKISKKSPPSFWNLWNSCLKNISSPWFLSKVFERTLTYWYFGKSFIKISFPSSDDKLVFISKLALWSSKEILEKIF